MPTRRQFIQTSAVAAAVAPFALNSLWSANNLKKFGFISGIIGKELKGDWKAVLKKTVEFGFSEIETGEYLGESADSFLKFCKEIGLKPVVGGIDFKSEIEEIHKQLDALKQLEINIAVVYWPWFTGGPFMQEECQRSAAKLNEIGSVCHSKGMAFCWHNHHLEFKPMEQGLPFDYLMEQTDPENVKCEMDIYWVKKGGADPLSLLKKYRGRFPVLHVKDMAAGSAQDFECPGSGIIDFPSIFRESQDQGIMHYMVERDNVPDGMACLQSAGAYLKNLSWL
jgi:sugar phosphate isomerase/epimerase